MSLVHLYPGALMQFVRSGHAIGLANLYTWLSFLRYGIVYLLEDLRRCSGFIAVYLIEMVIWFIHDTANAKRDLENQMVQEEPVRWIYIVYV